MKNYKSKNKDKEKQSMYYMNENISIFFFFKPIVTHSKSLNNEVDFAAAYWIIRKAAFYNSFGGKIYFQKI